MLNFLVKSVYAATPDLASSPYACEFNGLAELRCKNVPSRNPRSDGEPIRSATLAGLFVDALWATGGKSLTEKEMEEWYSLEDFREMKALGLNTVQILIPCAAFSDSDKVGNNMKKMLEGYLSDIKRSELDAIIALIGTGDEKDAVVAAAKFASEQDSVLALTLPSETKLDVATMIASVRVVAPHLSLFVPLNLGDLTKMELPSDLNLYGSLSLSHTGTIADIASSESQEDRSKLFYHEATSCMARSPLEYAACFHEIPVFVSSGFDLSIDDCANQKISTTFKDYGQCDRFDESTESGWWFDHRYSFSARQLYAYERGLGWSFAAWKLYDENKIGYIDDPAKLLSLKDVAEAGLFPALDDPLPANEACLNPPKVDFVLGDDTLAPTMGPPPDCGNGWWNYTTEVCDYWIPPPEPTPAPTVPCPLCETCHSTHSGAVGLVLGTILGAAFMHFGFQNRRKGYDPLPN